jgi:hypothetical protein
MFWKKKAEEKPATPARIARLDTPSLTSWFDTAIMELGSSFDKWRYHNGDVKEVGELVSILNNLYLELERRNDA